MLRFLLKNRFLFILCNFFKSIRTILEISIALFLNAIIDAATEKDASMLNKLIFIGIIFILSFSIISYLSSLFRAKYLAISIRNLKNTVFSSILQKNITMFSEKNSANYISVLNNDIKMIEDNYFDNILNIIQCFLKIFIGVIVLLNINITVAIVSIVLSFIPIFIPMAFGKKLAVLKNNYSSYLEKYNEKIKDIFTGFEIIKSFNIEKNVELNHNDINTKTEKRKYESYKASGGVNAISSLFSIGMQFSIFIFSGFFVIAGSLTVGNIVAITQLSGTILSPVFELVDNMNNFKSIKEINNKLLNIINTRTNDSSGKDINMLEKSIQIKNVSYSFNENHKILDNINLTLKKNKKYAIVGNSGSGKSTLLKLLLKYYDDYSGNIFIDSIDSREIKVESLYKVCSIIHQNVFMFDDSIKNNITLYNNYDINVLQDCINKSGLYDVIQNLKEGIDYKIKENGNNFSGGEKQRIAIARALIRGTKMLILDEATSSLDNKTAYNIERSLLDISDLTCLVVTHRYNREILRRYDEIIVLKDGIICEKGKFDKLIENKGYFYSLYNVAN